MKFHEMPYERVQLPDVTHAYEELIKELQAAKSGDQAALRRILSQVLSTDAGRRLAQQLSEAMKD